MNTYEWDRHVEYLRKSREYMWNDDYLEFLVERVWKITGPVDILDLGCGLGFLGEMLMPLVPEGSTYTGVDKGEVLLKKAEKAFRDKPYPVRFIRHDILNHRPEKKYDIAVCHTVLQHIPESRRVMERMVDSVKKGGLVICIEVDRNIANAGLYIEGLDHNHFHNFGLLQKLWVTQKDRGGSDHNIGMKLPVYLQELGLKDIGIRVNDAVQMVNPHGGRKEHRKSLESFYVSGWGGPVPEREVLVASLMEQGLEKEEAEHQYRCEKTLREYLQEHGSEAFITTALFLLIAYGRK